MNQEESIKTCIVIPVFNEAAVIRDVLEGVKKYGWSQILVVDDASGDKTSEEAGKVSGVQVFRHKVNRGKGAATKTGIEAAKLLNAAVIVTMDGDGQHDPGDIEKLARPIFAGKYDVALGTRLKSHQGMPKRKVLANYIGNILTWLLYGIWVTDSQSGMRAYSIHAASMIRTKADRYEYESEVLREIHDQKLSYVEVPIKAIYTSYSMGKRHKQGFINGIRALYKMIWNMLS